MITRHPADRAVIVALGRFSYQHLERQLRQRPGRYQQQVLAFDQVSDLAEQRLVEPMRAGMRAAPSRW